MQALSARLGTGAGSVGRGPDLVVGIFVVFEIDSECFCFWYLSVGLSAGADSLWCMNSLVCLRSCGCFSVESLRCYPQSADLAIPRFWNLWRTLDSSKTPCQRWTSTNHQKQPETSCINVLYNSISTSHTSCSFYQVTGGSSALGYAVPKLARRRGSSGILTDPPSSSLFTAFFRSFSKASCTAASTRNPSTSV